MKQYKFLQTFALVMKNILFSNDEQLEHLGRKTMIKTGSYVWKTIRRHIFYKHYIIFFQTKQLLRKCTKLIKEYFSEIYRVVFKKSYLMYFYLYIIFFSILALIYHGECTKTKQLLRKFTKPIEDNFLEIYCYVSNKSYLSIFVS